MSLGWILGGKDRDEKAFHILNMSGYNIGNFTMPFTAGFFGPTGVVITSLFDTGNAFICLGGAYSVASMATVSYTHLQAFLSMNCITLHMTM